MSIRRIIIEGKSFEVPQGELAKLESENFSEWIGKPLILTMASGHVVTTIVQSVKHPE